VLPEPDAGRGTDLPVRGVLRQLLAALDTAGAAVLVAPPGTGKTTLVPLAMADRFAGRIVVAEPRRVAARAAARRMASLLGEEVGGSIGYTVRGETRVGPATRVEVVTTGILVRRLQRDPDLPGTGAVVLDECHERHLDSDLALAFCVDVRATLRQDLRLLATSATADADRLAAAIVQSAPAASASPAGPVSSASPAGPVSSASPAGPVSSAASAASAASVASAGSAGACAPVVTADATRYPVEVVWSAPPRPVTPALGLRVDPRLLDHVAATVRRALRETAGDVLVFLPGAGEIGGVAGRLADVAHSVEIAVLHGRQSSRTQDAALRPGTRRRVILASAVAESSLTVPGVRVVVDAGLARVPRTDHARGLGSLATVRVSAASADQRAGRAGREAPGRVYRCWTQSDHARLPARAEPEIAAADLTGFALELACWGHPDGTGLALLDPPPVAAMEVARTTLAALGAVDDHGRITVRGRAIAAVGAHPRLSRAVLDGATMVGADRATQVVALLSDETVAGPDDDLGALWRRLRDGVDPAATARWRDEARRLRSSVRHPGPGSAGLTDDLAAGLLVGLAFPERLARARQAGSRTYLMAGGTAAELSPASRLTGSPWLAIAVADRPPGRTDARVRIAAPMDEATARRAGAAMLATDDEVAWSVGDVVARRVERLGAIVLADRALPNPDRALLAAALLDGLRREGLALLRWSRDAQSLRQRLAFCHRVIGVPWPDVGDDILLVDAGRWLGPELANARRRADLERIDVEAALRRLLPWPEAARLDELAPERLGVPSGSRIRVDYGDPAAPVLAVKVQEAFGWTDAPKLAGGRVGVVLHLLSPAGRPAAVTGDLASFWRTGYPRVRAELRGRYPRHAWPEDPTTAAPTRRAKPRSR
jgi:ATP-dependent helicase HrpB